MDEIEINKIYRHYKGKYYIIIAIGIMENTLDEMVVYKEYIINIGCMYEQPKNMKCWIRPLIEFKEKFKLIIL